MKYLHNCSISAFCKEYEDIAAVQAAIEAFLPENLEKEKISLEQEHLRIDQGEDLLALKVHTTKERHNKYVIDILRERLSKEQQEIILTQDNRVDEKGALYLRFDKEALVERGEVVLVDHGDCVHFRLLLAAFPKNREQALRVRDAIFS